MIAIVAALAARAAGPVLAQGQGVAVIVSPLDGATVSGLAPILGSAAHEQFQRYELAFAYSPNPTDTWFPIDQPQPEAVLNDVLGYWDTTKISDGVYTLRLRMFWTGEAYLEAFVQNVQVANATPTPYPVSPTPDARTTAGPPASATPAIILPPTATPRPTATPASAGGGSQTGSSGDGAGAGTRLDGQVIGEAFLAGVRLTLISFLILGAYASARAALRMRPRR